MLLKWEGEGGLWVQLLCSIGVLFSAGSRVCNKPVNMELGFFLGSLLFLYCLL